MTTSGFLPPSSRHGDCRCRPQSSPILIPTSLLPVKPTFCTRPGVERLRQALERRRAVGVDEVEHAVGQAAGDEDPEQRVAEGGAVVGRLPHDGVAAQQGRHEVPGRDGDREVAGGDDPGDADGHPEGEQLLVAHLARDGLAVEPPALAEEEVAGVDDLLHLAERLGPGLAHLADDEVGQRVLVRLDQAADLADDLTADRGRGRGPGGLGLLRRAERLDELLGAGEGHLGDDVVQAGRVGAREGPGGAGDGRAAVGGGDRAGHAGSSVAVVVAVVVAVRRDRTRSRAATPASRSASGTVRAGRKRTLRVPQPSSSTRSSSRSEARTASRSAGVRQGERAHQAAAADVGDLGVAVGQAAEQAEQDRAEGGGALDQAVALDDLEDPAGADHVGEAAAPGGVDAAAGAEDVVRDLVDPAAGHDAADLGLLAEGDDVGDDAELLVGPGGAGEARAGLHLVEDEQRVELVAERAARPAGTRAGSGGRRPRPGRAP